MIKIIPFFMWFIAGIIVITSELYKDQEDKSLFLCYIICWFMLMIELSEDIIL